MAKLKGPLFSLGAHGSLGSALTFSGRKSGEQVRFQKKQTDVETTARTTQRGFFQKAAGWWGELTSAEQNEWTSEGNNP